MKYTKMKRIQILADPLEVRGNVNSHQPHESEQS